MCAEWINVIETAHIQVVDNLSTLKVSMVRNILLKVGQTYSCILCVCSVESTPIRDIDITTSNSIRSMFGLFKKTASDEAWAAAAWQARPHIEEIGDSLNQAALAVGRDHICGWLRVEPVMRALDGMKSKAEDIEKSFKAIGEPAKDSKFSLAGKALKAFLAQNLLAVHWGKYHYTDASGDPGYRAQTETGIPQRAALMRINNNGSKFADAASKTSVAATMFVDELSRHDY